jgi:hypothetical protein
MTMMEEADLITYCGAYGGTCARWCGYRQFRDLASLLTEWVDAQGYRYWMPQESDEFDYLEFRKGLEFFSKADTWLVCRKCCKGGDGNPDCEIRKCCKNLGLDLCFECVEFPCTKVEANSGMLERAKEYQSLGRVEWLQKQVERGNQGFELHTRKYYQVQAEEKLPGT